MSQGEAAWFGLNTILRAGASSHGIPGCPLVGPLVAMHKAVAVFTRLIDEQHWRRNPSSVLSVRSPGDRQNILSADRPDPSNPRGTDSPFLPRCTAPTVPSMVHQSNFRRGYPVWSSLWPLITWNLRTYGDRSIDLADLWNLC